MTKKMTEREAQLLLKDKDERELKGQMLRTHMALSADDVKYSLHNWFIATEDLKHLKKNDLEGGREAVYIYTCDHLNRLLERNEGLKELLLELDEHLTTSDKRYLDQLNKNWSDPFFMAKNYLTAISAKAMNRSNLDVSRKMARAFNKRIDQGIGGFKNPFTIRPGV